MHHIVLVVDQIDKS